MTDAEPRGPVDRGVMTHVLSSLNLSEEDAAAVAAADAYIDEALDAVDDEEPSLLEWLQTDPDLDRMLWAHKSVMFWALMKAVEKEKPLIETVENFRLLISRMLAAVAWRATMRARERS